MTTKSAAPSGCLDLASVCLGRLRLGRRGPLDQTRDRIRKLGALVLPVIDSIEREAQRLFAFSRDRVVETDALDEAAIATIARVGDDDVEERPPLGPARSQSDDHHVSSCPCEKRR